MSDSVIRSKAIDPQGSYLVQAPAGSGKTELLTQRYLNLLSQVQAPEEIIAITFTQKAAYEMRHRILGALRKAQQDPEPLEAHAKLTWQLGRAALQRDAELGWKLLEHAERFRILTIDGLCAELASQLPISSGIGPLPKVTDTPHLLYRLAATSLYQDLGSDFPWKKALQVVLGHLDNQAERFLSLIANMLSKREQWLEVTQACRHVSEMQTQVHHVLSELREEIQSSVEAFFSTPVLDRLLQLSNLGRRLVGLPDVDAGVTVTWADWVFLAKWLLTKEGSFRQRWGQAEGFPAQSPFKPDIQALCLQLSEMPGCREALLQVRAFPEVDTLGDRKVLEAVLEILPAAITHLQVVFQSQRVVDFNQIALAALQALGQEGAPTDVALSLDRRLQHVLVDEFQDTSQLQFRLLEALTRGFQPGEGRTLFVVGDPLQSIYRFRQADVGLFLKVAHSGIGQIALEHLVLSQNFRSDPVLVNFLNQNLPHWLPRVDEALTGAVKSVAVSAAKTTQAGSEMQFFQAEPLEMPQCLVTQIRRTQQQYPEDTMAILVSSRHQLKTILPALRSAGISYRGVGLEFLSDSVLVQDLISLIYALTHWADPLSWMALLRSPWVNLSLADLLVIAQFPGSVIWSKLQSEACQEKLSAAGRAAVLKFVQSLAPSMAQMGRKSLREVVEATFWSLSDCVKLSEREVIHIRSVLSLLDDDAGLGFDRVHFQARLSGLTIDVGDAGARLEIMTIHKAKGLEFDTVFLPELQSSFRQDEKPLLLWQETLTASGVHGLLIAAIERQQSGISLYDYLWQIEKKRRDNELKRQLYVALTRAKKRLYLLAAQEEGLSLKASFLKFLTEDPQLTKVQLEENSLEVRALPKSLPAEAVLSYRPLGSQSLVKAFLLPSGDPFPALDLVDDATQVGILLHRLMASLKPAFHPKKILAELRALGLSGRHLKLALEKIERALNHIQQDPKAQWILNPNHLGSVTEYELCELVQGDLRNFVVDRSFIDQGVRWIIDYKFIEPKPGVTWEVFIEDMKLQYQGQLDQYARLFSKFDQGLYPIRKALYFPLIPRLWVFDTNPIFK